MNAHGEQIYSKSTMCDFLLMVNSNRGRITYRLQDIFACRTWKSPFLPTTCFTPPKEDPLEFLYELIPQKLEGWGYLYGENCIILTLTVFDRSTSVIDGQRDGR